MAHRSLTWHICYFGCVTNHSQSLCLCARRSWTLSRQGKRSGGSNEMAASSCASLGTMSTAGTDQTAWSPSRSITLRNCARRVRRRTRYACHDAHHWNSLQAFKGALQSIIMQWLNIGQFQKHVTSLACVIWCRNTSRRWRRQRRSRTGAAGSSRRQTMIP